jgi:hypothetical protein
MREAQPAPMHVPFYSVMTKGIFENQKLCLTSPQIGGMYPPGPLRHEGRLRDRHQT